MGWTTTPFIMTFVSSSDKQRYGSSSDRVNSYDDSLEIEKVIPVLRKKYPNAEIIGKPYGEYGIDVVVRENGQDLIWVELERSMGWIGEFRYRSLSFLERKFHFVQESREVGAKFVMCWFERNHEQLVTAQGSVIEQYEPFEKTLKSGRIDTVRHIDIKDCRFYKI